MQKQKSYTNTTKKVKLLGLFILIFSGVYAQTDLAELREISKNKEIKVGLVLSGGGAKGLAHIGAIRVLEDAGVQIDYIGGTSMGAIIGGLHAVGYSADQLDSIFQVTDFNKLIRDELPREAKTFFEREQADQYALSLPFDGFQIKIPSGLSKGQNVFNFLARLTQHAQEEKFSELPIPFFCVSTNLETGEEVILDRGSLALAMSISGAIPTVFRPIEYQWQLHTDGGVVNNYPVEELKRRGANFIIGVDVQEDLHGRERLSSGLEVMAQISNFRTIKAMRKKKNLTDIYIRPDIDSYSVLDFDKGRQLIENGAIAAKIHFESLYHLANAQLNNQPQKKRKIWKPSNNDSIEVNDIHISGNQNYKRNYILGKLRMKAQQKTSFTDLNNGLNNLSSTGNFNRINYTTTFNKNGTRDLHLQVFENQQKKFLRFALHYDDLYNSAILVNYTQKNIVLENDLFSIDLIGGDNLRYKASYYIDKGRYWSIGFNSRFNQFATDVDASFVGQLSDNIDPNQNINQLRIVNKDFTNQFFMESFLRNKFRFGTGIEQKFLEANTQTFIDSDFQNDKKETIIETSNLVSNYAYLEFDTMDHSFYPSQGFYFRSDLNIYWGSIATNKSLNSFSIAKGRMAYAQPIGNKFSLKLDSELGFRIGNEDMAGLNFFLGGYGNYAINNFRPFYGYNFLSLSGDSYIKVGGDLLYNFYGANYFIASANFANLQNSVFTSGEWFSSPSFSGYALGYGLDTFFGPIDIKASYSPEVEDFIWYASLGYRF